MGLNAGKGGRSAVERVTELGRITLSGEVVATLAGMAATECYGIVGMASTRLKDGIAELLGRENLARGVEVHVDGNELEIHLYIVVGYGTRISEIARNVTEKVRYVVESMTGLKVRAVRIHVQGVKVGYQP
ncbi:MAG: Asp23/Gls24 family envelope stress response protein [Bacillota bacterium]|nr:MAG: Asp23/Gls24 family envelope stress response protein [Bacillota bacterium]